MSISFNRVMLYVSDPSASVSFCEALGLKEDSRNEEIVRFVDDSGATIVIHGIEVADQVVTPGVRLYFQTTDIEKVLKDVERACPGVEVLQRAQMMPWGRRHAYLREPSGWEVSLYELDAGEEPS